MRVDRRISFLTTWQFSYRRQLSNRKNGCQLNFSRGKTWNSIISSQSLGWLNAIRWVDGWVHLLKSFISSRPDPLNLPSLLPRISDGLEEASLGTATFSNRIPHLIFFILNSAFEIIYPFEILRLNMKYVEYFLESWKENTAKLCKVELKKTEENDLEKQTKKVMQRKWW